jgi:hypothetical protein
MESSWWLASGIAALTVIGLLIAFATMSGSGKKDSTDEDSANSVKREPAKKTTKPRKPL